MGVGTRSFVCFLCSKKVPVKEAKPESFRMQNVTFSIPDVRHEMWKCNRCGSPVFDGELELHSSFHSIQDRLLERLMMALEKFPRGDVE
jgi:DNA-directed RNA polymerase subunit RPC12/RpoP